MMPLIGIDARLAAGSFGRTPVTVYFIIFKVIRNVFVDIVRFYFCRDSEDILTW